jgi:drug/metabolite transporter (DMT)-like permease
MGTTIAGALAAAAAAVLYNVGLVFQAFDARDAPADHALRLSLLGGLLRRPRWLLGTALTVVAWALEVVAMRFAPLTVVTPMLALGLVVLLVVGAHSLGEHVGGREYAAVAAIVCGVLAIALSARPRETLTASTGVVIAAMTIVAAIAILPHVVRAMHRRPWLPALSAGLLFSLSVFATKLAADELEQGVLIAAAAWALTVLTTDIAGLTFEMSALQNYPATRTAPIVFVTQITVPIVLAAALSGANLPGAAGARSATVAGFALVLAGAVLLASSTFVAVATEAGSNSESTVETDSPERSIEASETANALTSAGADPESLSSTIEPGASSPEPKR